MLKNAQTTADLVITSGRYEGNILVFAPSTAGSTIGSIDIPANYIWDGANNVVTSMGYSLGVELEKPFSDGKDGIYFIMEMYISPLISDDTDALCHWDARNGEGLISLALLTELEVEDPPLDGNGGFYFVQNSVMPKSVDVSTKTGQTKATFYHCAEVKEHNTFFVGAGPIGGRMKLLAFNWTDTTKKNLTSSDIVAEFTNEDLGGYAEISTAVAFTDPSSNGGSSSGCDTGMMSIIALSLVGLLHVRGKFSGKR